MSDSPESEGPKHWLEFPFRRIALCILVVYMSVATNYLTLDEREVKFLVSHPTVQLILIYVLAVIALREPGQRWLTTVVGASLVTGVFYLLAYGL